MATARVLAQAHLFLAPPLARKLNCDVLITLQCRRSANIPRHRCLASRLLPVCFRGTDPLLIVQCARTLSLLTLRSGSTLPRSNPSGLQAFFERHVRKRASCRRWTVLHPPRRVFARSWAASLASGELLSLRRSRCAALFLPCQIAPVQPPLASISRPLRRWPCTWRGSLRIRRLPTRPLTPRRCPFATRSAVTPRCLTADIGWSNSLAVRGVLPFDRRRAFRAITGFCFGPASSADQPLAETFFAISTATPSCQAPPAACVPYVPQGFKRQNHRAGSSATCPGDPSTQAQLQKAFQALNSLPNLTLHTFTLSLPGAPTNLSASHYPPASVTRT